MQEWYAKQSRNVIKLDQRATKKLISAVFNKPEERHVSFDDKMYGKVIIGANPYN